MENDGKKQSPDVQRGGPTPESVFQTTHWTLVFQAAERRSPESDQALAELCQAYWLPLYAYVRRRVPDVHAAQDLTQTFFTRLLEKNYLQTADPSRGRFRAFLLTALKRMLANEWDRETALKRGGGKLTLSLDFEQGERFVGRDFATGIPPDQLFLRKWTQTLLERVLDRLGDEFAAAGKAEEFMALQPFIAVHGECPAVNQLAHRMQLSEAGVRTAIHRLRRRYRQLLRKEVAQTVADPADVDDEIRGLFAAFG